MTDRRPFDKEKTTKIPFSELIELINQKCDYRFAIIDNEVDEELMALAKKEGIDLTGYKHVIETSRVRGRDKERKKQKPSFSITTKKKSPRLGGFSLLSRRVSCRGLSLTS